MTKDELFLLMKKHSVTVWGEGTGEHGEGTLVLERHGINPEHATELCMILAQDAQGLDNMIGLAALTMQALIFGIWLVDEETRVI